MNESTLVPRDEMSDLDWLARNVRVWVPNELLRMKPCDNGNGTFRASWCYSGDGGFTKDQWLARRAELQNKPSWGSVGSEINFISQHEDGQWIGHSEKPEEGGECFECDCEIAYYGYGKILGDWRDTLEKRPEQAEFEPFASVEDEHQELSELEMLAKVSHLISDKRHRKQFTPFASVEDAATAKQPDPKGSGSPILGMVLADLTNRALEGKEKYGEPLLAHNGRNPLWDAYQEALDLAMYLRQAIEEQK